VPKGVGVQVPSSPLKHYSFYGKVPLKIETVARDDHQTRLIAEFETEMLERYKRQAARKISRSAKIPGFRPGKAPFDVVRRMYGDEAIQQEAIELMLDEVYPQVLKEADLNPSGPGNLEEIVSMDPPTFAFVIPLPPEVDLGDYQTIEKEYTPEPVTEEQVENTILHLQRSYATAEPVERAAEKGDLVSFKVSARKTQEEDEAKANLFTDMAHQLVAGEEEQEQGNWPYEGFPNELLGMSAGETKTVLHTFTEDSDFTELQGQEAEFTIIVDNVKELHLPELNEEFAQSLGEFESVEDLRNAIRTQLEQNYTRQYDQNFFDELTTELVSKATVKYPPHLLDEEIAEFLKGVESNLERDRLDLETYLKMREMDRDTFISQEVRPAAQKRLERSLVLEEFARKENVEVRPEEIRNIYYTVLQQMQQMQDAQKGSSKNQQSMQEMANSYAMSTVNNVYNQRLMARLKTLATGIEEEPEAGVDTVMAEDELLAMEDAEVEMESSDAEDVAALDAEDTQAEAPVMTEEIEASEEAEDEPGEKQA
jgi:trigger factor